nr:unnamed protein product [uncultured bacterium]
MNNILTLYGLIELRRHEVRRARGERAGRYPFRVSLRLDEQTYAAVSRMQRTYAAELTESEILRIMIEYAAIFAPLRDELMQKISEM